MLGPPWFNYWFSFTLAHSRISHDRVLVYSCLFVVYSTRRFVSKIGERKVQGVPQLQAAAFPRHQKEEETDKAKQAQIEQTYKN